MLFRVWLFLAAITLAVMLGGCTPEAQAAWSPFWGEVGRAYTEGPLPPPQPATELPEWDRPVVEEDMVDDPVIEPAQPLPEPCLIAGNINKHGVRIYHLPGMAHYNQVVINPQRGERWFCSVEEAEAAGWRPAQR